MPEEQQWQGLGGFSHDHMHALGVLDALWRQTDRAAEFLIWRYLGMEREVGEAVTSNLGANARLEKLRVLVSLLEKDSDFRAMVEHGASCLDIVRANRNLIAHSIPGGVIDLHHYMTKVDARGKLVQITYRITVQDIRTAAEETWAICIFLYNLCHAVIGRRPKTDIDRPSMPRRLTEVLPSEKVTPGG